MRLARMLVFALIAVLSLPFASAAHDGAHKMMGTVTMAARDHVMLKTPDGKELTIAINGKTKVTKDKAAMKVEEIQEGTRVVVTVNGHKPPFTASQILVGVAAGSRK